VEGRACRDRKGKRKRTPQGRPSIEKKGNGHGERVPPEDNIFGEKEIMNNDNKLPERGHPAHFPTVEKHNRTTIIFLTVCSKDRKEIFDSLEFHSLIRKAWAGNREWAVGSYVIMPDHIHLFCAPATAYPASLKRWIMKWKSYCSRNWHDRKFGEIWQRNYWDRQLRQSESYREKSDYIRMNPVRKGLVSLSKEWLFQGIFSTLIWTD
jgi:putative transposase